MKQFQPDRPKLEIFFKQIRKIIEASTKDLERIRKCHKKAMVENMTM